MRHGLHHVGPGDEHVGTVLHHEDEVCHCRGIYGAARTGPHDHGDLRDDTGGLHIAQEDIGIATEGRHAFLNARATGIVQADDRHPQLHGLVHNLADLFRMGLRQGAAENGKILAKDHYRPPVDRAVSGHHAVARDALFIHAEIDAAMLDEHVPLFERAFVEQNGQPLSSSKLALGMLRINAPLAASKARLLAAELEFAEDLLHAWSPVTVPDRAGSR